MTNPYTGRKIAVVGTQPEALFLSGLFAEAGKPHYLVGHFDERDSKRQIGTISEARWLLGVNKRAGTTLLMSSVEDLAESPPSIVVLTGHAVGQRETGELERTTRILCKLLPRGAIITFTGLCKPHFTGTILRDMIEKHSGHKVGDEIHLAYLPLHWGGETLQKFKETPRLVAAIGTQGHLLAQEVFFSIFPSMTSCNSLSAVEAAGLFAPLSQDVLRALELELASLCEAEKVDYSDALDLCRQSGAYRLGIPRTFSERGSIASAIAIGGLGSRRTMSVVRAARRTNETGERKVLELVKNGLSLCGKRFRHSRIAILGLHGLHDARSPTSSPPQIIQTLEKRGAILSVYPGQDEMWFEDGVLGSGIRVENSPLRAASKTNCVLVALDSADFLQITPQKLASEMSRPGAVCDLSRVLEASNVERAGLFYTSIGRGNSEI